MQGWRSTKGADRSNNGSRVQLAGRGTPMTADTFRKDKFLRATGYNFYVWAVVNVLIVWPVWAAVDGRPWPPLLALFYPIVLIALGTFVCVLNDNRVEKMWGPPRAEP